MSERKKIFIMLLITVITLLAVRYGVGVSYYSSHFYPGTNINQISAGGLTAEEVEEEISSAFDDYTLTVRGTDSEDIITAEEVGLHYVLSDVSGTDEISGILASQNAFLWPYLSLTGPHSEEVTFPYTYDVALETETVKTLSCCSPDPVREPQDAYLEYADGRYQILPEVSGNTADAEAVCALVCDALDRGVTELSLGAGLYAAAAVTADDETLNAQMEAANAILASDITIETVHHTAVLDSDIIQTFLILGDDGTADIDSSLVRNWVKENVTEPNATVGAGRTLTTPGSGKFTVSGGNYGMKVDTDGETEQLVEELKEGAQVTREPVCSQSEAGTENDGIGTTYIDVNISQQMVYLVIDDAIDYSTACVTGNVSTRHDTPKGVYSIQWKTTNWTMKKYNTFVNYWMPINDQTGVGLHDATWRSSFGGNIYKTNGSHGCINLPKAAAQYIYENTSRGIPVIVH